MKSFVMLAFAASIAGGFWGNYCATWDLGLVSLVIGLGAIASAFLLIDTLVGVLP